MAVKIQIRRGTAANWTSTNPTLSVGELAFETDTGKVKVGNGSTAWTSLPYVGAVTGVSDTEIGYLDGVTSAIQTQLDAKASSSDLSTHASDTTNVHGIADTSALETQTGAQSKVDALEIEVKDYTDTSVYNHNADTTSVHGIADTSELETQTGAQSKADSAESAANSYTDTAIANLIDSSPTTLNTLNELAAALGDDPNFASTITTSIGTKATLEINTSTNWTNTNPVVSANVFALESNTGKFKIGNGVTAWTSLDYAGTTSSEIASLTSSLTTAYETYADNAITDHNVSTNIHGITNTEDLAYLTDVSSAITTHNSDTTSVHGISDTANLAYLDGPTFTGNVSLPSSTTIGTVTAADILNIAGLTANATELNVLDGVVISTTELNTLSGITVSSSELNVLDGITATTAELNTLDGITASAAELNVLDGITSTTAELNILNGVTATAAEINTLDGITATTSELNTLNGITASTSELNTLSGITASTSELNTLDGITATTTELNYVDGVTSAIQTQLNDKAPTESPTFTGTVSGITKGMVGLGNVDNTADADKPISTDTQSALDLKAPTADATFSGTISLPSTTSIGDVSSTEIGYVNGVTSAIQTQLDAKAGLSGATFTGSVEIPGLTITGNLVVQGTTTTVSAADLKLRDNMIYLNQAGMSTITNAVGSGTEVVYTTQAAHGYEAGDYVTVTGVTPSSFNISGDGLEITAVTSTTFTVTSTVTDTYTSGGTARGKVHFNPDLGWAAGRYDTVNGAGYAHAGMFRDASDGVFKIFDGYTPEPDESVFINTAHSSFALASIAVDSLTAESATIGDVSNTELQYLNGVTSAIQTQIDAKAPTADPTFTGTVTVGASGVAFTDGAQTKQGVPSITTISAKTDSYTLSNLNERDTIIEISKTSATTLTIPADSTVDYPVGTTLDIIQTNTGQVTIEGAVGVTVNATPGLKLRTRWSSATLLKRASNTWLVYGDLTA
jgi:hypothetical protein